MALGVQDHRQHIGDPDSVRRDRLQIETLERGGGQAVAVTMGSAQLRILLIHGARHRVAIGHGGHADGISHGHARFLHRCRMGCGVQLGAGIGGQCELHQKQRRDQNAGYPASLARYGASGEDHGANGIPSGGHRLNLDQIRACRANSALAKPQGVGDHGCRTQAHRQGRDHRRQKPAGEGIQQPS